MIKQVQTIPWDRQPLVRLLLPLLAGLGISTFFEMEQQRVWLWCIILFVWVVLFFRRKALHLSWVNGFLVAALFFLLGQQLIIHARNNTLKGFYDKPYIFKLHAVGASMPTSKGYKFEAEITHIMVAQQTTKFDAPVMVYVKDNLKPTSPINLNSDYWIHTQIKRPAGSDYPGAFDYQDFLKNKGIHGIIYIQSADLFELKTEKFRADSYIAKWRNKLLEILQAFCVDVNVRAIAGALLFGSRSEMTDELKQAYSTAGLVHVLAVSGMHVSMVCSLLLWIFDRFGRSKNKTLYCLPFVWVYALLAGMSSSVVRAAVMISFIIVGKRFFKVRNATNLLAATAFSLLIYKPLYFFDLGAQLSFAAVWGIQFLGHGFGSRTTKGIKNNVMELLRVCVVAQIATLPLTLYYFGNFPVYFLLANVIAVPLSSLIIYMGVAAYFVYILIPKFTALFQLMALSIQLLNAYSLFIAKLPLAQLSYLAINSRLLLIVSCFIFILVLQQISWTVKIKLGLMLAILVSLSSFLKLLHTNETSGFIIFNGRQSIVGFKSEAQIIEIISETDVEQDGSRHADYNRFKKVHWDGLKHCTIKADASKNLLFTFFNTKGAKKQTLYLAVFPHPEKADFEKMLSKFRPCVCVISADRLRTWDKARITEEIKSKTGRSPMFYKTATRGLVWHQK